MEDRGLYHAQDICSFLTNWRQHLFPFDFIAYGYSWDVGGWRKCPNGGGCPVDGNG